MKQNKSAKDIAFEKERAKFRSEIRKLNECINEKDKQIAELRDIALEREETIRQQDEWIARLLECTEMSKEDLQSLIQSARDDTEIKERIEASLGVLGRLGNSFLNFCK